MGISTDPRQLERLQQLEKVLELLQNPESYTRLLAEVRAVTKQQEEVAKRYVTVEAAERFLQESRTLLSSAREEDERVRKALADAQASFDSSCATRLQELEEREVRVTAKEKTVKADSNNLAHRMMIFDEARETVSTELEAKKQALAAREIRLSAAEASVRERAGQIAKLAQVS